MISLIMFMLMQIDPQYKTAFTKATEAQYTNSELNRTVDQAVKKANDASPEAVTLASLAYTAETQKKFKTTTTKTMLILGATTSVEVSEQSSIIGFNWHF